MTLSITSYAELKGVDSTELQAMIDQGVTVIDIRRPDEWQQTGIIPGSRTLMFFDQQGKYDSKQWLQDFRQWVSSDDQPFVLVCRKGNRTRRVGQFLADKVSMGQVYHLEGGIAAWLQEQRKVVPPK